MDAGQIHMILCIWLGVGDSSRWGHRTKEMFCGSFHRDGAGDVDSESSDERTSGGCRYTLSPFSVSIT